jgi:hypothetical protein
MRKESQGVILRRGHKREESKRQESQEGGVRDHKGEESQEGGVGGHKREE